MGLLFAASSHKEWLPSHRDGGFGAHVQQILNVGMGVWLSFRPCLRFDNVVKTKVSITPHDQIQGFVLLHAAPGIFLFTKSSFFIRKFWKTICFWWRRQNQGLGFVREENQGLVYIPTPKLELDYVMWGNWCRQSAHRITILR